MQCQSQWRRIIGVNFAPSPGWSRPGADGRGCRRRRPAVATARPSSFLACCDPSTARTVTHIHAHSNTCRRIHAHIRCVGTGIHTRAPRQANFARAPARSRKFLRTKVYHAYVSSRAFLCATRSAGRTGRGGQVAAKRAMCKRKGRGPVRESGGLRFVPIRRMLQIVPCGLGVHAPPSFSPSSSSSLLCPCSLV
jgi:hypothetical protein